MTKSPKLKPPMHELKCLVKEKDNRKYSTKRFFEIEISLFKFDAKED